MSCASWSERARQLHPIFVEQAQRLERQRGRDVARIVGERELVRRARRRRRLSRTSCMTPALWRIIERYCTSTVASAMATTTATRSSQSRPTTCSSASASITVADAGSSSRASSSACSAAARLPLATTSSAATSMMSDALARLADLLQLFARRLERLVEVARLPGAPPPDGRDPALARQPRRLLERRARGVGLVHRRRQHRHRAEEQGAAGGVALAQLLGVARQRGQLGRPGLAVRARLLDLDLDVRARMLGGLVGGALDARLLLVERDGAALGPRCGRFRRDRRTSRRRRRGW